MPSNAKDLSVVLQAQQARDLAPNLTEQVVGEMKSSLIFQFSWEELLQSAPTAINCMGACLAASSSPKAVVTLTPPKDTGFKYLQYTSIQANLVECNNMGRYAFLEAENGMGVIKHLSKTVDSKINQIIDIIGHPNDAKKMLKPQLNTLKDAAQQCLETSQAMDKKFEDWLYYVCEMHAACVEEENTTRDQLLSNEVCLAAEQTRLQYQKEAVDEARKASEKMGEQIKLASEAFKKASDSFPSGWDLMGQQIVGDLAGALTTALNAAIPALLDNLNPMAKIKSGAGIVGSFVHPSKETGTPTANGNGTSPTAPVTQPQTLIPQATDPAYSHVIKINTFLSTMHVILNGKDGNINWDMAAQGNESKEGARSSIKFLQTMFDDHKKLFNTIATAEEPSQTLRTILEVSARVAAEIQGEVEKSKSPSYTFPNKESEAVKKWQSGFAAQYRKANTLMAVSRSLPGAAANGVPLRAPLDPAVQTAQINAKTAQAQAVLEAAKNRLSTTQDMLSTTQSNYGKASEVLVSQQNKLGSVQAELTRLTSSNLTLTEVKSILIQCIKLIINLKEQITKLVRFFEAIAAVIGISIKYQVDPFLETIKAIVAADGTDPNKDLKIGDYTLTDFQASQVYSAAVTIRSYFGVFGDIASMWCELSMSSIMPGLKLCDEISVTADEKDPGQMRKKVKNLEAWSKDASARVYKLAHEKQQQVLGSMSDRIDEIKQTTTRIEAPPEPTRKAITQGTETTKKAALDYIKKKEKAAPLNRFEVIEDDDEEENDHNVGMTGISGSLASHFSRV
ncbi:uncharacterized protein RSE6_05064 [Rhynchosporium secalis]|uniref:Uncharacterized protein n=1 Tax=Rhynchosporium secalis TaxID=38038 RepID=A0A1E1M831_RHYSE|nr:uncharacterized protein RSE6_05064 [Rhynchosporium secalis]